MNSNLKPRPWMRTILLAAGVYNLVWGAFTVLAPQTSLNLLGLTSEAPVAQLWQCIGMIVGVYGIGYLIAARDAYRHWPITLVGLLGKVSGPIGFVFSISAATLPASVGWTIITNDLIWWFPFAAILWGAIRYHQSVNTAYDTPEADDPVRELSTNNGDTLNDLSIQQPQLVLFLRHAGCTFCREALADLSQQRSAIEASGCGIVLIHMGDNDRDANFFEKYGLGDIPRIADPSCRLYRQFGLDLGSFTELLGPRVWLRGLIAAVLNGHGVGRLQGNGFQMAGAYIYECSRILGGIQHERTSHRPNYAELAERFGPSGVTASAG
jgi:peroxiredoxin